MKTIFVILICIWTASSQAMAEGTKVQVRNKAPQLASLGVAFQLRDLGETRTLTQKGNVYEIEVPKAEIFSDEAYRYVTIIATFSPLNENKPAPAVSEMEIEIRILLRAWEEQDLKLSTNYFLGAGENAVYEYEITKNLSGQRQRHIGSLLLLTHFQRNNVRAKFGRVVRAANVAVESARIIGTSSEGKWFVPSNALRSFAEQSVGSDAIKVLDLISGAPLKDLNAIEENGDFMTMNCDQKKHFFEFLKNIEETNQAAAALYIGTARNLISQKRDIVMRESNC